MDKQSNNLPKQDNKNFPAPLVPLKDALEQIFFSKKTDERASKSAV